MAELIDKWDVVNKLIALENEFQHYKPFHGFEHAMYCKICELEIAIGKTLGVEVVRCKDCKHFIDGYCDNPNGMDISATENAFCSCGERRNNG